MEKCSRNIGVAVEPICRRKSILLTIKTSNFNSALKMIHHESHVGRFVINFVNIVVVKQEMKSRCLLQTEVIEQGQQY